MSWVFFADTINFSFWQPEDGPQYVVTYKGKIEAFDLFLYIVDISAWYRYGTYLITYVNQVLRDL
jgi:hypothetical protein